MSFTERLIIRRKDIFLKEDLLISTSTIRDFIYDFNTFCLSRRRQILAAFDKCICKHTLQMLIAFFHVSNNLTLGRVWLHTLVCIKNTLNISCKIFEPLADFLPQRYIFLFDLCHQLYNLAIDKRAFHSVRNNFFICLFNRKLTSFCERIGLLVFDQSKQAQIRLVFYVVDHSICQDLKLLRRPLFDKMHKFMRSCVKHGSLAGAAGIEINVYLAAGIIHAVRSLRFLAALINVYSLTALVQVRLIHIEVYTHHSGQLLKLLQRCLLNLRKFTSCFRKMCSYLIPLTADTKRELRPAHLFHATLTGGVFFCLREIRTNKTHLTRCRFHAACSSTYRLQMCFLLLNLNADGALTGCKRHIAYRLRQCTCAWTQVLA